MATTRMDMFPRQDSFVAGVLTPSLYGAFSLDAYKKGLRQCVNWIVTKYGTLLNRPGTVYASAVKTAAMKTRLFTFDFSDGQAYGLEFGDQYIRVRRAEDAALVTLQNPSFTVLSSTGGVARRSTDCGVTFSGVPTGLTAQYFHVASKPDGSEILAVGEGSIAYSTNGGTSFTEVVLAGTWRAARWNGTRWIIVGYSAGDVQGKVGYASAGNGVWTTALTGDSSWYDIAFQGTECLAVGHIQTTNLPCCSKSTDGGQTFAAPVSMAGATSLTNVVFTGVVWDGSAWIAAGYGIVTGIGRAQIGRSTNGSTWTNVYDGTELSYPRKGLYSGSTTMFAANGFIYRSPDSGTTWIKVPVGEMETAYVIEQAQGIYIVSGSSALSVSYDGGYTWVQRIFKSDSLGGLYGIGIGSGTQVELTTEYVEADLANLRLAQSGDVVTISRQGYVLKRLVRVGGTLASPTFVLDDVTSIKPAVQDAPTSVVLELAGDTENVPRKWEWVYTWQAKGGRESISSAVFSPANSVVCLKYPATIRVNAVPGAERYHIYRGRNGLFGWVGSVADAGTSTVDFHDDGDVPLVNVNPPTWEDPFVEDTPGISAIFQARQVFGNTLYGPATLTFSATDAFYDFDMPLVRTADDAFKRTLGSTRYEEIRWLAWVGDLLAGTSEGEWAISGAQNAPVAFDNLNANEETHNGSSWVHPLVINKEVLFVQSRGNEIRNLYRTADGWDSDELSVLAEHLFKGRTVVDWAFARRPYNVIWVILDDGELLSMTYDRKGGVWAWSKHTTYSGDLYESVTTVPYNGMDVPWFTIQRGSAKFVEYMAPRHNVTVQNFCYFDSAVWYSGVATTTITGLSHLEGRVVYGLADSKPVGPFTVSGGEITLATAASNVWVGLRITAQGELLDYPDGKTLQKNVIRVWLETSAKELVPDATARIYIGESSDTIAARSFDEPDGMLEQVIGHEYNPGGRCFFQLQDPVPLEIKGVTREIEFGE